VLEPGYRRNCKQCHVSFCEMTSPRMDCSYNSCLSGLFYGTTKVTLRQCDRDVLSPNFNPVKRRMRTNHSLWVYSVNQTYTFEVKCETVRGTWKITLKGTGLVVQPEACDWVHETMTLKDWRSFQSSHMEESNPVPLPKIKTLFLKNEH